MNKEPIGLYIFRFILAAAMLGFMAMLYWSSVILEEKMLALQLDISQINSEINALRGDIEKGSINFQSKENVSHSEQQLVDSKYENLLAEDTFYKQTLPKMLGPNFKPEGVRRNASIGKPEHLHPFLAWKDISDWYGLCVPALCSLATGQYELMVPEVATRMEVRENEKGEPEYWLFLRKDVYWLPLKQQFFGDSLKLAPHFLKKHPLTAHDYKFYYDALTNPNVGESGAISLRTIYNDISEVRVVDDYTLVVKWKTEDVKDENGKVKKMTKFRSKSLTGGLKPLPGFVYKYFADGTKIIEDDENPDTYKTNPIWAQNFVQHWAKNVIVSCGAWEFDGVTDQEIRFVRNPTYFDPYAALTEKFEVKFKNSPDSMWEEFKIGLLDWYSVQPQQLSEMDKFLKSDPYLEQKAKGDGIGVLSFTARQLWYIGLNQARPIFQSKKVRQAITLAVDRDRIIRQTLNGKGMPTTGTFFPYSSSYDKSIVPYPFNPQKALQLMHEEGWYDSTGDGILDKEIDGKKVKFEFSLNYYVKDQVAKSVCEYVATALKEIGVKCNLVGLDVADISAIFEDKNFDAYYLAWALGTPPDDPRQLWYSSEAKLNGSSNAIGFMNKEIDKIIDQLDYEYDPQKRIQLYHQFDKILYDEAPYIFIFVPTLTYAYREYLQNVFIPAERKDLIPNADVVEPISSLFWIKKDKNAVENP